VIAETCGEAAVHRDPEARAALRVLDSPQRGADVACRGGGDVADLERTRVEVDGKELAQRFANPRSRYLHDGKAVALVRDRRKAADRIAQR